MTYTDKELRQLLETAIIKIRDLSCTKRGFNPSYEQSMQHLTIIGDLADMLHNINRISAEPQNDFLKILLADKVKQFNLEYPDYALFVHTI